MGGGIYLEFKINMMGLLLLLFMFSVSNKNLLPCCYNPHFPVFNLSAPSSSTRNERIPSARLRGIWLPPPELDNPRSHYTNILKGVLLTLRASGALAVRWANGVSVGQTEVMALPYLLESNRRTL